MPIYDFNCKRCSHDFDEVFTSYDAYEIEKPKLRCPNCKSKRIEKQISKNTSFILKGSGWTGKLRKR